MDKTKVVIADDHPILRDGLRKLLEAEQDFAVVGEAVDGHGAVEVTRRIEPNILLLDLAMPGLPGLEVLRALNGVPLATRTILLTANIERDEVVKALQLGARGLVMKDSASELLMKAMRMVMAGQYWIGRESVSGLVETLRTQMFASSEPKFGLTPRELEIVAAVAAGYSNKEMAQRFSLSQETVKHHLTRIYNKLHVTNRLELALFAISQHLVER
ncbi:MAG: DNA-binding response regulator [Acidobacteria bacterium]|nr:MAG: DNA-binding response regulator [Acidobacteriota bacterium]PYQ75391.1 MAG: DNA-binding response regulator [Acidobacteriota bacterium]PYQ91325.1 MAG: DNA-binding response regulator [Acidobacteriota bacterium]PYR04302.1 MAG: DNA-binding response regulator [Acidobacteriota bacterium]